MKTVCHQIDIAAARVHVRESSTSDEGFRKMPEVFSKETWPRGLAALKAACED